MLRTNLQDYIILYQTNPAMRWAAIKGMERLSEWDTAASYWEKEGEMRQAEACKLLAESVTLGDKFRAEVAPLNQWVKETVEQGVMTEEEALKIVYPKISKIYDSFYPKGVLPLSK